MVNVKYIISGTKEDQPYKDLEIIKEIKSSSENKTLTLLKNPTVVPRARIVTQYKVVDSKERLFDNLKTMGTGLYDTVLLENSVNIRQSKYNKQIEVKWIEDKNQYINLRTNLPVDGILVLADMYEENWKAYDNGHEISIQPANFMERAVVLKKGKHDIEFKYEPASFYLGMKISVVAYLIVLGTFVFNIINPKKFSSIIGKLSNRKK